jgi:hemoglobin
MSKTMFERYGGFANVSKVVMAFYDKALDSDIIGRHFEDVEMRQLIDHQTKFVASVMGGPVAYTDEALQRLHAHLDINQEQFDEMTVLLRERKISMKSWTISMPVAAILSARDLDSITPASLFSARSNLTHEPRQIQ